MFHLLKLGIISIITYEVKVNYIVMPMSTVQNLTHPENN